MVAISFINKTRKSKFKGTFNLDAADYEYTMYLLPITKQKEYDEIVDYFGNRMFKGSVCLDVDESAVEDYLNNDDVSYKIFDISGKEIKNGDFGKQTGEFNSTINIEGVANGIYTLILNRGGVSNYIKLCKF